MGSVTAIILGVLQGVTEFLPVSSSGHLILGRELFSVTSANALAFDAVLQMATALAIIVYFRKSLYALFFETGKRRVAGTNIDISARSVVIIAVATVPAVIAGLLLEPLIEGFFRTPEVVAGALVIGSGLLFLAERWEKVSAFIYQKFDNESVQKPPSQTAQAGTNSSKSLSFVDSFMAGCFQCLALVPGMSRSGSTIAGGVFAGMSRETATSFSFLLGLPILLGAGGRELFSLASSGALSSIGWPLLVASIAAFLSGLLAMNILMRFVKSNSFDWFVGYRVLLAILILIFL